MWFVFHCPSVLSASFAYHFSEMRASSYSSSLQTVSSGELQMLLLASKLPLVQKPRLQGPWQNDMGDKGLYGLPTKRKPRILLTSHRSQGKSQSLSCPKFFHVPSSVQTLGSKVFPSWSSCFSQGRPPWLDIWNSWLSSRDRQCQRVFNWCIWSLFSRDLKQSLALVILKSVYSKNDRNFISI